MNPITRTLSMLSLRPSPHQLPAADAPLRPAECQDVLKLMENNVRQATALVRYLESSDGAVRVLDENERATLLEVCRNIESHLSIRDQSPQRRGQKKLDVALPLRQSDQLTARRDQQRLAGVLYKLNLAAKRALEPTAVTITSLQRRIAVLCERRPNEGFEQAKQFLDGMAQRCDEAPPHQLGIGAELRWAERLKDQLTTVARLYKRINGYRAQMAHWPGDTKARLQLHGALEEALDHADGLRLLNARRALRNFEIRLALYRYEDFLAVAMDEASESSV